MTRLAVMRIPQEGREMKRCDGGADANRPSKHARPRASRPMCVWAVVLFGLLLLAGLIWLQSGIKA